MSRARVGIKNFNDFFERDRRLASGSYFVRQGVVASIFFEASLPSLRLLEFLPLRHC
jgi:hypothetical protein